MNSNSNAIQTSDSQRDLHQERVRILYTNIRGGLLTYYGWWVSVLLVLVVSGASSVGLIVLATAIISASLVQSKIQKAFFNAETIENESSWERREVVVSSVEGLIVSVGAMLLLDLDQPLVVYTVAFLVVAAAFAGALSLVASIQTYYGWALVLLLPLVINLGLSGNSFYMIIAGLVTLGGVSSTLLVANNLHKGFLRTLELRFENLDLLEKVRHERNRAEQASRDKTRFLASASHDLRQPIHALGLFSDALEYYLDKPEQLRLMAKIKETTSVMNDLLYSLLDISRLDAGIIEIQKQALSVPELLQKIVQGLQYHADDKKLKINIECPPCWVISDVVLLESVLTNLLSNAIKYTDEGSVNIQCRCDETVVSISIQDTGIGISNDDMKNIFDEFFQAGNPERDRKNGLGLGLAIVQRTCALLDHQLDVKSEVGIGSTFTISLKAAASGASDASAQIPFESRKLDATVLVIDDEDTILDAMIEMLQPWGCEVLTANTQEEALLHMKSRALDVDIIIADYRLRGGSLGTEVVKALEASTSRARIPAIIISGDTAPNQLLDIKKTGMHLLHKPVAAVRMRALIQTLLKQAKKNT